MSAALLRYRVMAYIVGCFVIIVFTLFFAQLATDEASWFNRHATLITVIDQVHGVLYMVFLVITADLARRARFSFKFTILIMLAGTVPGLSFVAERFATRKVRARMAEQRQELVEAP